MWGNKGVEAIINEMKQFHDRNAVKPLRSHDIKYDIKKKSLGCLMFLKQKRDGNIKGRGDSDDRPQRLYKSKTETSLPTSAIESVSITGLINAK